MNRRTFLHQAVGTAAGVLAACRASPGPARPRLIDTHMHVWAEDLERFPFSHPYQPNYKPPRHAATAEAVVREMDEFGITHCVLVQTIFHGWDNRYLVHCLKAHPGRFRGHGLIDPTDPKVADKLEFWVREHGLVGMRMSPIYYRGKDGWLNGEPHRAMWKKAGELKAVFNYFIAPEQLPRLEDLVARFPEVRVVVDHLGRIDLKGADPLADAKKLVALARYPNVRVKLAEWTTLSPSRQYPYTDTFPWVRRVYDAFGPGRLLWGTGYPGAARAEFGCPSLADELALIRREIPFFTESDREKILGLNAAALWEI